MGYTDKKPNYDQTLKLLGNGKVKSTYDTQGLRIFLPLAADPDQVPLIAFAYYDYIIEK